MRVRWTPGAVHAEVDGQLVALNPTTQEFVAFNEVGEAIWLAIGEEPIEVGDIAAVVLAEFDVDPAVGQAKIIEFVDEAVRVGLLEASG